MDEQTVYGVKAALALLERRPQDVLRLLFRPERLPQLKGILSWAASQHLPYRQLDEEALRKVAGSPHHEGLVVVAKPLLFRGFDPGAALTGAWLALDGVDNPHNLGAILRSCAFFGVTGVLVGGAEPDAKVNQAVLRVAEGGAEHVRVCAPPAAAGPAPGGLAPVLAALAQRGVTVLGLETDASQTLLPGSAVPPMMLVVGNEQTGLSPAVRAACSAVQAIRGSGAVTSLNVSVTAGVALAWLLGSQAGRPDR